MGISITLIRATPCCRVTKVMIQKDVEEKKFFEREWNVMHHDVLFDRWARPGEMDSEEVFENRNGDEFLFRWAFNWSFHRGLSKLSSQYGFFLAKVTLFILSVLHRKCFAIQLAPTLYIRHVHQRC